MMGSDAIEKPKPASAFIPDWYKNTPSYLTDKKKPRGNGGSSATIKRCVPVFDALTAGYIITLPADVYVSTHEDGSPWYEWSQFTLIEFHSAQQLPHYPLLKGFPAAPKFINPWGIETPKGYSVFITQPVHRDAPFTILDGIVDTDTYKAPINFPFVLNDPKFEGLIPQGTPIAQIIPIKRESWKMEIGKSKQAQEVGLISQKLQDIKKLD